MEEYLNSATRCVEGSELCGPMHTFYTNMFRSTNNAISKIARIKSLNVQPDREVQHNFQQFRIAVENAHNFVSKIDDFTFYCSREDRITTAMNAVKSGNFGPLAELVDQLHETLRQAEEFHREFQQACQTSSLNSRAAAEFYKGKTTKARNKKRATGVIGGTAAAGAFSGVLVSGGIAASVLVGLFTFGTGAVIGLSLTAGALGAGGIVTTIATGAIVIKFRNTEKSFNELSEIFDYLVDGAFKLEDQVLNLQMQLRLIKTVLSDVDINRSGSRVESVCATLELLYNKNTEAHTKTSRCRDSMKALEQMVRSKVSPLPMWQSELFNICIR